MVENMRPGHTASKHACMASVCVNSVIPACGAAVGPQWSALICFNFNSTAMCCFVVI